MSTNWTTPSSLIQYAEDESHIAWNSADVSQILSGTSISCQHPLLHIARQPRNDIKMKTYFLRATGFNFINLPSVISGIECRVSMKRSGRITDDTIQLCFNNEEIGENRANLNLNPIKVYGSNVDTWNIVDLDPSMLTDPTFGVILRFQSHPRWPHSTTPMFNLVELQIH